MKLHDIAHSRAGDKGETLNLSLIAFRPGHYALLEKYVTAERVRTHFVGMAKGKVIRYLLPSLHAMNFVLEEALDGGVTRALSLDPHGKCLSSILLNMEIPDE